MMEMICLVFTVVGERANAVVGGVGHVGYQDTVALHSHLRVQTTNTNTQTRQPYLRVRHTNIEDNHKNKKIMIQ